MFRQVSHRVISPYQPRIGLAWALRERSPLVWSSLWAITRSGPLYTYRACALHVHNLNSTSYKVLSIEYQFGEERAHPISIIMAPVRMPSNLPCTLRWPGLMLCGFFSAVSPCPNRRPKAHERQEGRSSVCYVEPEEGVTTNTLPPLQSLCFLLGTFRALLTRASH